MDQQTPSSSFLTEILASIQSCSSRFEEFITSHPTSIMQALAVGIIILLVSWLLWLRQSRSLRLLIRRQESEIARLNRSLEEVGAAARRAEELHVIQQAEVPQEAPQVVERATADFLRPVVREGSPIAKGLQKSRAGILSRLAGFFGGRPRVDASALDDLEELLIASDVGARCSMDLVSEVRDVAQKQGGLAPAELTGLLQEGIVNALIPVGAGHRIYQPDISPLVVLVVGVNGVGKTTTVAKLAARYIQQGKKVLAVAADTFRAAAVEQLAEWSQRVGFALVRAPEGAKPSAVVFDGMVAAKDGGYDVILIDTAGRLHTKSNLMQELEGVRNVIRKHVPEGPHETVLVLDGVSGQNALHQAREFNSAVALSGLVVTKLDGTPKGGIVVAISKELQLPVFFIGVGERVGDLVPFDRIAFTRALFEEDEREGGSSNTAPSAHAGNT